MRIIEAPRRALHIGVGIFDLANEWRREVQGQFATRLEEFAKRGESRLNNRNKSGAKRTRTARR